MSSGKRLREEKVVIEYNGKTYEGYRVIEGTQKLFQTIHYLGTKKFDGHAYKPHQTAYMGEIAKSILRELIEEYPDG
ncbi:MAG: hypothetical protein K9N22_03215 [Candidatus Marinimicrobia bacterium]|nr:hypothetical protein [Candidatus Neomarinimicrobiota bacterium]